MESLSTRSALQMRLDLLDARERSLVVLLWRGVGPCGDVRATFGHPVEMVLRWVQPVAEMGGSRV